VIVANHDEEAISEAITSLTSGTGAGVHGRYVVAEGTPAEIMANENSITGNVSDGQKRENAVPGRAGARGTVRS